MVENFTEKTVSFVAAGITMCSLNRLSGQRLQFPAIPRRKKFTNLEIRIRDFEKKKNTDNRLNAHKLHVGKLLQGHVSNFPFFLFYHFMASFCNLQFEEKSLYQPKKTLAITYKTERNHLWSLFFLQISTYP